MKELTPVPLWLKISYTLFVMVLIPVYWQEYGPGNFLWFSDIALFAVGIALWTKSRLLISMMATGVLALEIAWNIDFFFQLITGIELLALTNYMFDESIDLYIRLISLFHIFLPVIVIWLLIEWGYNKRAILYQTVLTWAVLPLTYWLTAPEDNINWVYGFGEEPQDLFPPEVYLLILMVSFPAIIHLPSHLVLKKIFKTHPDRPTKEPARS